MNDPQSMMADHLVATLTEVVGELRSEIGTITAYSHHTRHLTKLVALSVVFDIVLSFGLGYGIHRANSAQGKANNAVVVNCQAANDSRKNITDLWGQVLPLLAKTDAEQTLKIKDFISTAYAQRDCAKAK